MTSMAKSGNYIGFPEYLIPEKTTSSSNKRLINETRIIKSFSTAELSDDDLTRLSKWVDNQGIEALQKINISLLDFYKSNDTPIVFVGLNEHRIIFECKSYPFQFPKVYKEIFPNKMIDIKLWVDKNVELEAKIKFFQKLQNKMDNKSLMDSHILNVIVLLTPLLAEKSDKINLRF